LNNHLKTIRVPKTAKKNVTVTKVASDFSQLVNSDDEEPEMFENVRMALKSLNERERKIIQEYFGIDFEKRTLSAIGEDLGIGKERVKQIKNVALKKIILCLRKTLKNDNRN
jgi:RNA polymerase primary sigma factor